MTSQILVLNSGSSSIKYCLYRHAHETLSVLEKGHIDRIGQQPILTWQNETDKQTQDLPDTTKHIDALRFLLSHLQSSLNHKEQLSIGHRVVHGGIDYHAPVLIDDEILGRLNDITSLAPLHQPYNLAAIEALREINPELLQVACFDTAFHAAHGKPVDQFGLPAHYYDEGIRRYGFHGLSYEYLAEALPQVDPALANGKIIAAHLGNGASLCAIENGQSIDSSMGFSALDGLMMGTRCGSIDAGVLLYLLQEKKMDADELSHLLYKQSGLLGVSGISNDMRDLLNSDSPQANEAIELYVYRMIAGIGSMAASLSGLEGLIFTGGIGENAAEIRTRVCAKLNWLGLQIDERANKDNETCISSPTSRVKVYIIPTNEELMIARHTVDIINRHVSMPKKAGVVT